MSNKKIYAEDLKKGDVIIIPASSHAGTRFYKVSTDPELNDLVVNGFMKRMRNATTEDRFPDKPLQFGRKVDLEIVIQSNPE